MKRINKTLTIIVFGAILGTACVNDLDTQPLTDTTLTTEDAWNEEATYEALVAKVYAGLAISGNAGPNGGDDIVATDQGEATFTRSYWNLQELPTDEAVIAWSDEGLDGIQFNRWVSTNRFCEINYNRLLINIAFCNEYLIQTTDGKLSERGANETLKAKVNVYRNEIRAMRALNYYILLDLYGNPPFVDEESGTGSYAPQQIQRADLFNYIESELKNCLSGELPAVGEYGKINKGVVNMILAKLYLNAEVYAKQSKYNECVDALNELFKCGYSIEDNYQRNFNASNDQSSEIIFPIVYDGTHTTTYGGTTYLMAAAFGSDMEPTTNYGLGQSWSGLKVPEDLSTLFEEGDIRALFYTKKRTQNVDIAEGDYYSGWSCIKFTNLYDDGSIPEVTMFASTDFPMYRLADAYLMYAEAVLRGATNGSRSTALGYINDIRTRANASTIEDADMTLGWLIDERARELYWEAHRRTDLIRFGYFTDSQSWKTWSWKGGVRNGVAKIDEKYNLYPIPSTDLTANSNLKQNTGF